MTPYYELPGFASLYLEDSYLTGVRENAAEISFDLLFVLTEAHSEYQPPVLGEQYCYKHGRIIFEEIATIEWLRRELKPSTDPDGSVDYGNIDSFYNHHGIFELEGEWGKVRIRARNALAALKTSRKTTGS